jgi:hypothetical protein
MKIEKLGGSIQGRNALARLLSDENISVRKIFLSAFEDVFYIFYEEAEEQLNKEKGEASKLDVVAQKLEKDESYKGLKNETQRTIYLLQKHDIPSSQSKKVIELLNMRKIVIENGLSRTFEKGIESGDIKIKEDNK